MQYNAHEKGYYLPLSYNDNKIVLLVRDPQCLFAYWEISDEKKQDFIKQYGEDSWNDSIPVIKLTNSSEKTVKFIDVNDLANNWYIEGEKANCAYSAELGRMLKNKSFVALASSNTAKTPQNRPSQAKPSLDKPVAFANYKELKAGQPANIVNIKTDLGKYEQEFDENKALSSAELSRKRLSGLPGVSSDSFIK